MRTVRRFVGDLWKETNRLNAKEVGHTLADMYYASASLGAHEVAELVSLWLYRAARWARPQLRPTAEPSWAPIICATTQICWSRDEVSSRAP